MPGRLDGRIALITGAAQGIGLGIATMFVKEGALVIATDLDEAAVRQAVPGAALAMRLDVTDPQCWAEVAENVHSHFGKLHVLVNNAGNATRQRLEDCSLADWRFMNAVNSEGPFLGVKALLDLLKVGAKDSVGGASIVNMSSVAGIAAFPGQSAYNTSKAAVAHFSKSLATEFAHYDYNIRVNSIHPGMTWTPLMEKALTMWPELGADPFAAASGMAPLKRMGTPEDIAFGAVYLASDEAGYVTGAQLVIDGGIAAS